VGNRGAGGARAAGHRLSHPTFVDSGSNSAVGEPGEPRDVRAVGEQLVLLDRRTDRGQVERRELRLIAELDRALWVTHVHVLKVPALPGSLELAGPVLATAWIVL